MAERYVNFGLSTLASSLTNSATSLTVADGTKFPTGPNFRIVIENEILLVTAVSGSTFTVTRGYEGTTAVAHGSGLAVANILTSGSLGQILADRIQSGPAANKPSPGTLGEVYLDTDSPILWRDNGTTWMPFGPLFALKPPTLTDFTWVNQSSATATQLPYGIYVLDNSLDSGERCRLLVKNLPAAPYTITMGLQAIQHPSSQGINCGIILRDSSSSKIIGHAIQEGSGGANYVAVFKWDTPTQFDSTPGYGPSAFHSSIYWIRVYNDGTNFKYSISTDGANWLNWLTESNTAFTSAINQAGFYINCYNANNGLGSAMTVFHYNVS